MELLYGFLYVFFNFYVYSRGNDELELWTSFKIDFNKSFNSTQEESHRMKIFYDSLKTIEKHNNRDGISFDLGINQFADMTSDEFIAMNTVNQTASDIPYSPEEFDFNEDFTSPDSFDWRDQITISKVKDQKRCGSCYAMAAIDTIENHLIIKNHTSQELSVQEIVDCAGDYHSWGCEGGMEYRVYDYIADNGGISSALDYKYVDSQHNCTARNHKKIPLKMIGYGQVTLYDEDHLKQALVVHGPISISIEISHETFMRYAKGIYYEPNCSRYTNHAAVLVGYGTENGDDYWIVKNSYGETWGENGYIRVARNRDNHCGIGMHSIYPILEY